MEWQPIETAPKGVPILMFIKYGGTPLIGTIDGGIVRAETEHYEVLCGGYCLGGLPTAASHLTPTHWMPLPEPPNG